MALTVSLVSLVADELRSRNLNDVAENLLKNGGEVAQYLRKNSWTEEEMTSQWNTDTNNNRVFGKMTDGLFRNTKGVRINSNGVYIYEMGQWGHLGAPYIYCRAGVFEIWE